MALKAQEKGRSVVETPYAPTAMDNICQRAHGGVVLGLIDEAFETSSQTNGAIAAALNVNVPPVSIPTPGRHPRAVTPNQPDPEERWVLYRGDRGTGAAHRHPPSPGL